MSTDDEEEAVGEGGGAEGPEPYPYGKYQGSRDQNLDRHGFGRAILPNGDLFEGNYDHGYRVGKGMYVFKNGARYNGTWKKGMKYGQGEFNYPDGSKYVGRWRRDMKHGQGTYYYPNGDTYEGSWFQGFRHGYGVYTFKNVNVIHTGIWVNGRMEGPGILDFGCYKYHGSFEKNLPKGPGCFVFGEKFMQFGFYINVKNPDFDYVDADQLDLNNENKDESEYRGNPRGIVPIWRARKIVTYREDLLPPGPIPSTMVDSEESLLDIVDYLERVAEHDKERGEEEEMLYPSPVFLMIIYT